MPTHRISVLAAFAAAGLVVSSCRTAAPNPAPAPARPTAGGPGGGGVQQGQAGGDSAGARQGLGGGPQAEPSPRPYARVITGVAKTRSGLFKTHRVGSRLYYEIPRQQLNRDMLVVTRVARVPVNAGYGGQQISEDVVRWERRENRVLLRHVQYGIVADSTQPIAQAVNQSNNPPILAAFNVEAYGPDSAAVIDVTRLYLAPPTELGPGQRFRGNPDASRSFIEYVAAFPENVEVEATLTIPPPPTPQGGQQQPQNPFAPTARGTSSIVMHWSMVKLPEQPMMPRVADSRVGYFSVQQIDYGRPEQRAQTRRYINRYRLEPKDAAAFARGELVEPVKPIVYYVDAATPDWLKPYVRRGIEDWQEAFEAAGFRNAIIAKDPPSRTEDPDWSPEDARYSVIRWFPSTIENAQGPNTVDPRTGEIIEADVYMYHNIMNLQRSWYFTQVGHLDPRALMNPFPDSLMGRLVQFVVAHEVGHTLGFPHNQKGSVTYPVDSVRSRTWVAKMGHSPSIMDYSRFNYTAQPEDSIPLPDLVPRIGPYDKFVTMWGYKPIPGAKTADDERPTLNAWARMQDTVPWYRYMTSGSGGADPQDHNEAVGDADAVKATTWGLRSIKQIVPLVMKAAVRDGENYDDLTMLYTRLIGQWTTEMRHVADVVGSAETFERFTNEPGKLRFNPLPKARHKQAVRFLNEHAFQTPTYFLDTEILRRLEPKGAIQRINNAQRSVLNQLLNDDRLERLIEYEALAREEEDVYSIAEMLNDVRRGVWSEIYMGRAIDPYRRALQRSYLEIVDAKLNPPANQQRVVQGQGGGFQLTTAPRPVTDVRGQLRGELRVLDGELRGAIARSPDGTTRRHLEDARMQIEKILNPER